eukprot:GHVR01116023.1.p1 GENE.GHVR01116023.1~~GHVR01116023.1.p1  ORF type:complete len:123 (+),score=54.81 GHVR01116023.1:67-435(+)
MSEVTKRKFDDTVDAKVDEKMDTVVDAAITREETVEVSKPERESVGGDVAPLDVLQKDDDVTCQPEEKKQKTEQTDADAPKEETAAPLEVETETVKEDVKEDVVKDDDVVDNVGDDNVTTTV